MKKLILLSIIILIISSCSHTGKETYYYKNGNIGLELNYVNDIRDGLWKGFYPDGQQLFTLDYKNGDLITSTLHPYNTEYYEKHYYSNFTIENNKRNVNKKSEIYFKNNHVVDVSYKIDTIIDPHDETAYAASFIDSITIYDSAFVSQHSTSNGKIIPKYLHIFRFKYYYLNSNLFTGIYLNFIGSYKYLLDDHFYYFTNYGLEIPGYSTNIKTDKEGRDEFEQGFEQGDIQGNSNKQTQLSRELRDYIRKVDSEVLITKDKYAFDKQYINYSIVHHYPNGKIKEIIPLNFYYNMSFHESFTIDGYIKKFDENGNIIKKTKYINGVKVNSKEFRRMALGFK